MVKFFSSFFSKGPKRDCKTIVTIPPYAPYIRETAKHPVVSGLRLNTIMPLRNKENLEDMLKRIRKDTKGKDFWLDLKTRQIRVTNYATTPYHHLEISHKIKAKFPIPAFFNDGLEVAMIAAIEGKKIIMLDGPKRVVGPGESINILDPSLEIEGFLTDGDRKYIEAAKKVGMHQYMLSYVEQESDITDVLDMDPDARLLLKIESERGLDFVKNKYQNVKKKYGGQINLMAARGDLYVEVEQPHKILRAMKTIIKADPKSVCASRIFGSLRDQAIPSCSDITDFAYMNEIGYRRYLIGDDLVFNKQALISALNLMQATVQEYVKK